jgi:hypothetical protein
MVWWQERKEKILLLLRRQYNRVRIVLYCIVLLLHDVVLRRVSYKYQLTICD